MKPKMSEAKVPVPEVVQSSETKVSPSFAKPIAVGLAVCLIFTTIAALVTVVVVSAGKTKPQEKETWITIKTKDGTSVQERLSVSDLEEEIFVPDQYHAVFDFRKSLLVIDDIKDEVGACLVLTFNRTNVPDPQEVLKMMNTNEVEQGTSVERDHFSLAVTEAKLDNSVLSEKSKAMCEGKGAYWAIPSCSAGSMRQKRAIDIDCEISFSFPPPSLQIECSIRISFSFDRKRK